MSERETNSATSRRCPRCGAELPANVPPDLCPKCLLQAALPTQAGGMKTEKVVAPTPIRSRGLPQPGQQLGHYRIVRLLGEGGMGAVFDAEDLESGRRVALKVLSQALDSPEARERFFREGRMAASINHPNSVYVFGTEEIGGTPAIAMELVAGGTLQDRVRERGPLPVAEAVDCVLQIIAGLEAAQRIGILHRDIKPSNCFRDANGTVKIGDFGLSISTTVRTEPALTATGAFLGTPAFSSPEQLRGDELNVRSDMYSVGTTLFYLLTGRTPFEARNTVQLLATVLEQRAPSPAKFRPGIPKGLAKAVLRCLEKQPGERFKNYRELGQALAPYSSAAPTPATLGLRFLAGVLDQLFLTVIWVSACSLAGVNPLDFLNLAGKASPKALAMLLPILTGTILYYAFFEGAWGAAVGKLICRLRIVGPDRNVPGFGRALARALIYVIVPMLPFRITYGPNPKVYVGSSTATQSLMGLSFYIVLALLFCAARRRNGFAAVQDLVTKTRVISRAALESRTMLVTAEMPPPAVETGPTVGPYHILETLGQSDGTKWLLGYDLRLLRKVWIRVVPPGTPPVPAALRNVGRVGRLRWLTGRRSAEENWDAFEAAGGRPLVHLAQTRQPWSQVRYWLYDLAMEISAAAKDDTLPAVLALDRVWITGDGRAKLLDFPAPGIASAAKGNDAPVRSTGDFLVKIAAAAMAGRVNATAELAGPVAVPLPLHARDLLDRLPQFTDADTAADTLKPLLQRAARVTRWRRAAIVAGCLAGPVFFGLSFIWGARMLEQWDRTNPGLLELNTVLQQHTSMNSRWLKNQPHPTDRQFAIYIASHYRSVVTNEAIWTGAFTMQMIKGEARRFAEQSIANYPAPTQDEVKDADAALKGLLAGMHAFDPLKQPWFPLAMAGSTLVIYVCIPALIAALLFRGGLVLLIARVTFVRKDGMRASRLRVFWRALVAWSPLLLALVLGIVLKIWVDMFAAVLFPSLFICGLAILSLALPDRGLPDRLAGTWPVPR
ncbi:MAG TPA: protein kinase [Verrucomicrobiae bacterium]|nr:protein kinase [Verrucomicrobiae bacterium]